MVKVAWVIICVISDLLQSNPGGILKKFVNNLTFKFMHALRKIQCIMF